MEMLSPERFDARCGKTYDDLYDVSVYVGLEFDCACGGRHEFSPHETFLLKQLAGGRFVMACADGRHVTCVKFKGIVKTRFISLFGSELLTPEEVASAVPLIGDRGPGPKTGYYPVLSDDVRMQTGLPQKIATSKEVGADGNTYWITVILRWADDLETIEPILAFVRGSESEAREVHSRVATVVADLDLAEWNEALPTYIPDDLIEEGVRSELLNTR